jgi:hypothetical protein
MKIAPHLPQSHDLAFSDFSLFGYINHLLTGHEITDRKALLDACRHLLDGIETGGVDRVFLAWMERPEQYLTTNGEYVE